MTEAPAPATLEEQRAAFSRRRALNMPLAGTIAWIVIGIGGAVLETFTATLLVFAATGSIVYVAMLLSRFTGDPFFRKDLNVFDRLFFAGMFQALLVYAIAIPFFLTDHRSVTLTVGILTGLMWMPYSWIVQHWIGYFHAIGRTVLVLLAWYAFPMHHFQAVAAVIVVMYIVTIVVLEKRWKQLQPAFAG